MSLLVFLQQEAFTCYTDFIKILHIMPAVAAVSVNLLVQNDQVVLDNGLLQVTFTNPGGLIVGIRYNGLDNLLELNNPVLNGGFWDLNWSEAGTVGTRGVFDMIEATEFEVIEQNEKQTELSFKRPWDPALKGQIAPLTIDKRFVMLPDSSGFYSYAIYEHGEDMPAFYLNEARMAFMLKIDKFHYMAMADDRQRYMPLPEDRVPPRGRPLAYPEAVLLVDPVEPEFQGEVDDKYQYSCKNIDNQVHGFICSEPPVGFWQITPSNEFRTGGPFKQDLTSHVNPTTLAMFVSTHYGGVDLILKFEEGEIWKKVFGPVFMYVNSVVDNVDTVSMWNDAKEQMKKEVEKWPYSFPVSVDFPHGDERGSVTGRLFIQDRYISEENIAANGAYVGLAPQGKAGSFQTEGKGYQFWVNTDEKGSFLISNIRPGDYDMYAWIPGFIGEYHSDNSITIAAGCQIDIGDLLYMPPKNGPTLWEIGIPDRSAAEFFIPDPSPEYVNKLYIDHPADRFRQYGLWERYANLYPEDDLVYTVGVSDYQKDWFYAQVTRKVGENAYKGTTWQVKFELDSVDQSGSYTLRIALASATVSNLEVRINNREANPPQFSSGLIGSDNSIARHGIHGLYWLFSVEIPSSLLNVGENTLYLTQARNASALHGIMYDYVRLEYPES